MGRGRKVFVAANVAGCVALGALLVGAALETPYPPWVGVGLAVGIAGALAAGVVWAGLGWNKGRERDTGGPGT